MKAIEVQFRKGEFSYIENKIVQEETKVAPPNQQPEKHRRKQSILTKDWSKSYRSSECYFRKKEV